MPAVIAFSVIILAGGRSSRMGQDKTLLPLGEETILQTLVKLVRPIFEQTLVIVNRKAKLEGLGLKEVEIYEDLIKERGPLAGIYTGLCYSKTQASCVLTCDMPWIDELFIQELLGFWEEDYDGVCLEDPEGNLQPFPGLYARSSRHLMRLLLDQEEYSLRDFFQVATLKPLLLKKERIRVLTNMNTIEDYYQVLREKDLWAKGK